MTITTDDSGGSTSFKPFANSNQANDRSDDDNEMDIPLPVQFVGVSLQQLKQKLDDVPYDMKSSLVYAQHYAQLVNAELVNDNHLLGFLYVEKFNIDLALQRLLRYWTNRHKLFGDKYIQPLTLYGAMSDRIEDIRKGFLILLPVLDDKGRAIIYANNALMGEEQQVEEVLMVWWYLIHVAVENFPSVRKKGFILLGNDKDMRLRHFHPRRGLVMIKSGEKDFPVQLQSIHLCNPMAVFPLVATAAKVILPMRLRQNLTIHTGSSDEVLESLASCSIPSSCIPICMGGTLDTSSYIESFITGRLAIERRRQ